MKAKKIFEKFLEDSDPIKDMGIGNPEKYLFPRLDAELNKYDISISWKENEYEWDGKHRNLIKGCWNFDIFTDIEMNTNHIDLSYCNAESAKKLALDKRGEAPGFIVHAYNKSVGPTHDINEIVKRLLTIVYGDKYILQSRIQYYMSMIQKLKKIEKVI